MSKLSFILIAAIASGGAAVPAFAQDDLQRPSVTIHYNDLNLSTSAGRERLDTRVRMAIKSMCSVDSRSLRQRAAALECEAAAKRSVEPQVAALYNGSHARFASEKPPLVAAP
ncbi:UrcA family protein [Sphingopyxis sp.]|uniref:UrcA family protein n=1 Tax=Sphingopyxis sp. TaxID=1908224 RepID=UPI003BADB384